MWNAIVRILRNQHDEPDRLAFWSVRAREQFFASSDGEVDRLLIFRQKASAFHTDLVDDKFALQSGPLSDDIAVHAIVGTGKRDLPDFQAVPPSRANPRSVNFVLGSRSR